MKNKDKSDFFAYDFLRKLRSNDVKQIVQENPENDFDEFFGIVDSMIEVSIPTEAKDLEPQEYLRLLKIGLKRYYAEFCTYDVHERMVKAIDLIDIHVRKS